MSILPCIVGIDVSKATLDIFETSDGKSHRIANATEPLAALVARWREAEAFVVFEATGCYDEALRRALDAADVRYSRVDPFKARSFARYSGFLAKTDKIDARMLAELARRGDLKPEPPIDENRETLRILHRRRDQLVAMRKSERTRLSETHQAFEQESLERHIAFLSAEIDGLERAITDLIGAVESLARMHKQVCAVPGVGLICSTTILALLPELGQRSGNTVAALAGLAPFNRDSGKFRGQRRIGGGRSRVREALYMAAVAASRTKSPFATFYKRLRDAGKPAKLALIALARKILVTLNAIVKNGTQYAA